MRTYRKVTLEEVYLEMYKTSVLCWDPPCGYTIKRLADTLGTSRYQTTKYLHELRDLGVVEYKHYPLKCECEGEWAEYCTCDPNINVIHYWEFVKELPEMEEENNYIKKYQEDLRKFEEELT